MPDVSLAASNETQTNVRRSIGEWEASKRSSPKTVPAARIKPKKTKTASASIPPTPFNSTSSIIQGPAVMADSETINADNSAQHQATKPPNKPPKPKDNIQRPKNKVQRGPPKASNKSTKETVLTNDPLWLESFVLDGETGFTSEEPTRNFNVDAAGFIQLVESEYKAISDVDKYYAKSVSASAHAYYHTILLWYKTALAAQKHGVASNDQERLVQFEQGYTSLEVASGVGEYLAGLGDFTDATGVKHIMTAQEPNANGNFGQAAADTHGLYETLPVPQILLHRIAEDLRTTVNRGDEDAAWL